jgi:hypothetical protein
MDAMKTTKLVIPQLKCKRCGHTWLPRITRLPKKCAGCQSPYWNRDRLKPLTKHTKAAAAAATANKDGRKASVKTRQTK